jgi:hypothetical protein
MLRKYAIKKRTKDELTKGRCVAAKDSAKIQADAIGYKYPMPWTTEEAQKNKNSLVDLRGTKLTLVSRIASVADATDTRFEVASSKADAVKYLAMSVS